MALTPQQLEDLRRQAEIYRDVNRPPSVVLPDKLKHALRLLSDKKRALLNLPYPVYPGDMKVGRPPESLLAEDLRERYARKGRSLAPMIEELGTFSPTGALSEQRGLQEKLLEQLLHRQTAFAEKQAPLYGLNKDKILDDLTRLRGLSAEKLLPLAEEGANLASERRGQLTGLFKGLQEQQNVRRQGRLDELKKLGHLQKYREKKEKEAEKQEYEFQARYPWKHAALFEEELKPLLGLNSQSPPELQEYAGSVADIAKNALDQPYQPYKGKRVANLPVDIDRAQDFMKKMVGPSGLSLKDNLDKIMEREQGGEGLLSYITPHIEKGSADLERQTEDTLQQQKQALDAKYIRLGQYGGGQHQLEQEKIAQEMLKNLAQKQHSLLGEGFQRGVSALHGEQMRRARTLGIQGEAKQQRFEQLRDALRGYRRSGTKNFLKDQKGLDSAYQDFLRQWEAVWPHRRREILMSPGSLPMMERKAQ